MALATYAMGRCDVLAVARECVQARERRLQAMGVDAGIELPCGALPWVSLDEHHLRRLLEQALDGVAARAGGGSIQLALWREATPGGPFRLRLEAYADDPAAGLSFELALLGGEVAEPAVASAGRSRALLVEDHPARRRILDAQFARLGVASETVDSDALVSGALIAGRYGLVWLGASATIDRVALVASLRLLERKLGHRPARVAGLREDAPSAAAPAGIDAWVDWPPSLDELRRFCADTPAQEEAADALFFREGLRDTAAIRSALNTADWAAVARHAHRIKGGTIVLGENGVCALAGRIEAAARRLAPDRGRLVRLLSALEERLRRASP
ncbi:Hpt domain-containing protein [Dyella sp. 2RAB6]|uniref:Hpt domain-containing protein n=1 Tax=Dyella sp. 2RAB6 TaxID=3232992 RepID=UPI003F9247F0